MLAVGMADTANLAEFGFVGGAAEAELAAGVKKFLDLKGGEGLAAAQLVEHEGDAGNLFQGFGAVVGVERAVANGQAAMTL